MSVDSPKLYFQTHIGQVDRGQMSTIAGFLKDNGVATSLTEYKDHLTRTRRHPFSDVEAIGTLSDLDSLIEEIGVRKFIFKGAISQAFPRPMNLFWDDWVATVNTGLGRSYLKESDVAKPGDMFVKQSDILRHIDSSPLNRHAFLVFDGFQLRRNAGSDPEKTLGIPGNILLESPSILGTRVKGAFDYKSTNPTDDKTVRAESLKRTFDKEKGRRVLRDALAQITGIEATSIDIPRQSPVKLVVGSLPYEDMTEEEEKFSEAYDGEPINVGLPNINRVALLVLKIATGGLQPKSDPTTHFREYLARAPYQGYTEKYRDND